MSAHTHPLSRQEEYPLIQQKWAGLIDPSLEDLLQRERATRKLRETTGVLAACVYHAIGYAAIGQIAPGADKRTIHRRLVRLQDYGFPGRFVEDKTLNISGALPMSKENLVKLTAQNARSRTGAELTPEAPQHDAAVATAAELAEYAATVLSEAVGETPIKQQDGIVYEGVPRHKSGGWSDAELRGTIDQVFYWLGYYATAEEAAQAATLDVSSQAYKNAASNAMRAESIS
jgi:hypothetical protein